MVGNMKLTIGNYQKQHGEVRTSERSTCELDMDVSMIYVCKENHSVFIYLTYCSNVYVFCNCIFFLGYTNCGHRYTQEGYVCI
jgi:hypothetical protein